MFAVGTLRNARRRRRSPHCWYPHFWAPDPLLRPPSTTSLGSPPPHPLWHRWDCLPSAKPAPATTPLLFGDDDDDSDGDAFMPLSANPAAAEPKPKPAPSPKKGAAAPPPKAPLLFEDSEEEDVGPL